MTAPPELVPAQLLVERVPTSRLSRHVACVWVHAVSEAAPPYEHLSTPDGCGELACELGRAPRLAGPRSSPFRRTLEPGATVVGVRFRPGALAAIVGVSAPELVDLEVEAGELLRLRRSTVRDIVNARSAADAAAALELAAEELVADSRPADGVASAALDRLEREPTSSIASIATGLFVTERTLRRRCIASTGFSPKALQRLARFRRFLALSRLDAAAELNLGELAVRAGYSDQAHLSRESRRLAQQPPGRLVQALHEHCVAVHRHAESASR